METWQNYLGKCFRDFYDANCEKLKKIDISSLTPLEALNILQLLKNKSDKFQ